MSQRDSSQKGFESTARHTTLVYVLSNIYKVKLTACTMKLKRNGCVELRVQITFFSC